jgi:hypothetical protein
MELVVLGELGARFEEAIQYVVHREHTLRD